MKKGLKVDPLSIQHPPMHKPVPTSLVALLQHFKVYSREPLYKNNTHTHRTVHTEHLLLQFVFCSFVLLLDTFLFGLPPYLAHAILLETRMHWPPWHELRGRSPSDRLSIPLMPHNFGPSQTFHFANLHPLPCDLHSKLRFPSAPGGSSTLPESREETNTSRKGLTGREKTHKQSSPPMSTSKGLDRPVWSHSHHLSLLGPLP